SSISIEDTNGVQVQGSQITRTDLFRCNHSQAVRLPKDVAFPEGVKDVIILRDGARRVIVPSNAVWDDFFAAPGIDLGDRNQPEAQAREAFCCFAICLTRTSASVSCATDRKAFA